MTEIRRLVAGDGTRLIMGDQAVALMRRIVESQPVMRPGRFTIYLGRPDPAEVRSSLEEVTRLVASARRAVVVTPPTTPLPSTAERRDPGFGWLAPLWFSAVLGPESAMAVVADTDATAPDRAWLLTDPTAVRRFVAAVEGELARPDPQLLAV
ncbi:MAG TPA: hypothetical protein VET65_13825 [Candidatus Limnocylindrales bacterium]|nr:hypothetical protein [Candidatus Limnocylindrales bacterium]